ncbi:MAG: NusA-like transcription termination signal-binding factor [Natronomonas sp.]
MAVTLSDAARRYIALFDAQTDVTPTDCIVDEEFERVVFVVPSGSMGQAIGAGGEHVRAIEDDIGRDVEVVEDAPDAEGFVANALAPAAVYNVTVSGDDETVAYAEVDDADRGVAIGADGRNIRLARQLAERHFGIETIELT